MNNQFVTDTMALVLRLEKRKLINTVKSIFESTEAGKISIYIPSIVFAEILYLSEKNRIKTSIYDVKDYLNQYPNVIEHPLDFSVITASLKINDICELHDRLIAGTALALGLPLLTNDPVIQSSKFIQTIW